MNAVLLGLSVTDPADHGARSVSRSHVGLVRAINEDRVLDCAAAGLWAVADGMGGHRGGDLAAQTAIDELRRLAEADRAIAPDDVHRALAAASAAIAGRNRALGLDAGTTIVTALLVGDTVHIAWVGDSRAYRLRADGADLLTHDHSVVQELVDAGLLSAQQAESHPHANVVTRALGMGDSFSPDSVAVTLGDGDRLLLCSDGLSRSLRPDAIDPAAAIEDAAGSLLTAALARDGSDNISLVLIER